MKRSQRLAKLRLWIGSFRDSRLGKCLEEGITEASILLVISGVLKLTSLVLEYESVVGWAVNWIETAHQITLVMAAGWLSLRLLWTVIEKDLKAIRELQRDMKAIKEHRKDVEEIVELLDNFENIPDISEDVREINELHDSISQTIEDFEQKIGEFHYEGDPDLIKKPSVEVETEVEEPQE